jgi:hypothetical protein
MRLTFGTKTSLYAEDRGLQVPMPLEHLLRPYPRVKKRENMDPLSGKVIDIFLLYGYGGVIFISSL